MSFIRPEKQVENILISLKFLLQCLRLPENVYEGN